MTAIRRRVQIVALIRIWLLLDFFADARRAGNEHGSSLTTTIMWQSLLALGFAALLYPDVAPVPFAAANLCLSTLLIAIGSLGDEQRPLRQAADQNLLATAPVAGSVIVLARTGHAAFQLILVTAGMALAPAILLAHLRGDWRQAFGYVAAACACSGLATGSLATLQVVTTRLIGAARATLTMGTLKALLLGGGFVLFALALQRLGSDADALPIGRIGAEFLPPYHAAMMLADPAGESWRLLPWAACAIVLLLTTIGLTANANPVVVRITRHRPLARLLRAVCGRGPRLGIADFVAATMWRSTGFRARVLPLIGLPAGMVFLTLGGKGSDDFVLICLLLQLPAIYLPFLIAFLPRADQADTGWVFDHAPGLTHGIVCDASWRALVTHVLVPVHCLAFILVVAFGPDRLDRAAASLFAFGVSVLAAERMARLIDRVPFTATRDQDRGLELGALLAGAMALGGLGAGFGAALPAVGRWLAAGLVLVLATVRLRQRGDPIPALLPVETGRDGSPAAAQTTTEVPSQQADPASPASGAGARIGAELRAVAVLYAVLCVLPWLIGAAFAP